MLLLLLMCTGLIGFAVVIRAAYVCECISVPKGCLQFIIGGYIVLTSAYLSNQVQPPGYEPACGSLPGLIGDDC